MISAKSKIQDSINKKAQKIRDQRLARDSATAESIVFTFFSDTEDSRRMGCADGYAHSILQEAINLMIDRIRLLDLACKVEIVFTSDTNVVQGVMIKWSPVYQAAMNSDATLYIDMSDMLFL